MATMACAPHSRRGLSADVQLSARWQDALICWPSRMQEMWRSLRHQSRDIPLPVVELVLAIRHTLDTSAYTVRIAQFQAENKLLRTELTILRDNPTPSSSSAWKGRGRSQEGAMRWRLEGRSLAAGRTSFVLDGHGWSVSGTGSIDADAGSTPTLVEPPVPTSSPLASEGPKDALDPQVQLEKRDDTETLETRIAELTFSSRLELALAASQTIVAELGT
ncbi:hypothetical protein DFH08DRAFT_827473 [Mycena albidolilacea]|uniref:Uncharacterized protein n=1 Tax=Mycena albidolilacea TaxID=1033008 RepID=A0AAD6YY55_9AGAR|nr:hypothetical protein DFH08DRAFT_827473 [Mycena albidolilacea]